MPKEKTEGTAILTCRNHPTYRWTQTKYTLPGATRTFIGRGTLLFDGEEGGLPSSPLNMSEASLETCSPEFQEHYRRNYTPECICPESDLIFLAWTE